MLYSIKNLQKIRPQGYRLLIRDLHIAHGDKIAITGPSGCGKSTALDILGLCLRPESADEFSYSAQNGSIAVMNLWKQSGDSLADLRRREMGYVLQSGELLPYLDVGENILLPCRLKGLDQAMSEATARELLKRLGIERHWHSMPATLSVGERQRVAIARAIAPRPAIILADEPTAALDPLHAEHVMQIFLEAMTEFHCTLVLATHNAAWAASGGLSELRFSLEAEANNITAILDNGQERDNEPAV